jgi:hypothetical protein
MKRTLKHTAMLMLAALMFTACSKDDDNNNNINVDTSKNYVQYNGTNYTIGQSQLVDDYEDWYENGTYGYGIRLFIENSEEMVEVDFLLANSTIPEGSKTYNYSNSHQAGTMDAFFYDIGSDSNPNGTLTSGSAMISKNGNTYEISFNVKLPDGKIVLGHYKETVEEG